MPTSPKRTRSPLEVEYLRGIHLVDSVLWLDAPRRVDLSFLSHAHLLQPVRHGKVLCTEATARLAGGLLSSRQTLLSPYYRRFALGGLDLELHPAGHVLGAAQLRVTSGGRSLVYTGHFDPLPARTVEAARVLECDLLVVDAGDSPPGSRWPERALQERALIDWVEQMLADRGQPVLLAPALGEAQELARLLGEHGLPVRAQRTIYEHCRTYHALGVKLPGVKRFRGTPGRDEVVLFPYPLPRSRAVDKLPRPRLALVGRPGRRAGAQPRQPVLRTFEWGLAADQPALLHYASQCGARRIHVAGRFAEPLAAAMRARGLAAWPVCPPQQLELFAGRRRPASS